MYTLKNKTPPASEPITLTEAKAHLRIDDDSEDTLISSLITAARDWCETFSGRSYIMQTWEMILDSFPDQDFISIPRPPLQAVSSIKYYGTDNTEYTMPDTDYFVDTKSEPGRLNLAYGKSWPSTILRPANGVILEFSAGYQGYAGTVNTAGVAVTKVSGDGFNPAWQAGKTILINGALYQISAVASATALTLANTAGNQTGVVYSANDVPEKVKAAIKLILGHLYEHRLEVAEEKFTQVPMAAQSLLWQDRIMTF
jgi:uncharacterized phiE125 gp8 family phage protein